MLYKLKDSYFYIKSQMAFSLMFYDCFKGSFVKNHEHASKAAKSFAHMGYVARFKPKGSVLGIEIFKEIE